jgi:RNA polymerase sigma-70 factor (ECF subfamily)
MNKGDIKMQNRSKLSTRAIIMKKSIKPHFKFTETNFAVLYRQYATRIYRYIFTRVSNRADAEDLTSQVFMAALKGVRRFNPGGNVAAWLFTIARNKIADSFRKLKPVLYLEDLPGLASEDNDTVNLLISKERAGLLSAVLKELDVEKLELLQLRFAGELTYAEIGSVVGKTEAAVKMAIHRILRQLEERMEKNNA